MKHSRTWQRHLILIWCIGLMLCSVGCKTIHPQSLPTAKALAVLVPPIPPEPAIEPVRFVDREGGLWLSYEQYRALERNIIALREYAQRLEIVIEFYEELYHDY
jgi:hypothetical protein